MAFVLLVSMGCAGMPAPSFDRTYLPNTTPGAPQQRIDLSSALERKLPPKPFFGSRKLPQPSLTWLEKDTLLATFLKTELHKPDTWLYSFLVSADTGTVKQLTDAEQDAIRKTIERNEQPAGSNILAEIGGVVITLAMAIISGGRAAGSVGSSGTSFDGTIENNGHALHMEARLGKAGFTFTRYQWRYTVENKQTGKSYDGHYRPDGDMEEAFESWIKSWRISPDGRYYLIGKTASLIDSESEEDPATIMSEYGYRSLDVNPSWDRIALLLMESDEKTGRVACWIEFYPFQYRTQGAAKQRAE